MNILTLPTLSFSLLLNLSALFSASALDVDPPIPVSTTGAASYRSGAFARAIDELTKEAASPDTAVRHFKLGLARARSGETAQALASLRTVTRVDEALAPLAWKEMGDLLQTTQPDSALACYRRALAKPLPSRFRNRLFESIQRLSKNDTAKIAGTSFYSAYVNWWKGRIPRQPEPLCNRFDSLLSAEKWPTVDSLVQVAFAGLSDSLSQVIVTMIHRKVPSLDSAFSTTTIYLLGRIAMDCGLFDIAERMLSAVLDNADFKTCVSDQSYLRFRGRLYFYQKKYGDAIETLTRYTDRFGYESDIALLIARAYGKIDRISAQAEWYDKFIARAEDYPKLAEFLWRRAWLDEELERPLGAKTFYRKIFSEHPQSRHAEESWIRYALCFYRLGQYDSTIVALREFEKKQPLSTYLSAAQYWQAKCHLRLNRDSIAYKLLTAVSTREPFDYYAFRARELFVIAGDTARGRVTLDTSFSVTGAIAWLDSVAPPGKKLLSRDDSLNLRRGLVLALLGNSADARQFINPVELSYPSNLPLGFKIGAFCGTVGATAEAALAGRRLSWRIPPESRAFIPLPVYALMYPRYFFEAVTREAAASTVDPYFVYAVMRQESVFDPAIVSPAGAIGLMQIMPYTGKDIAKKLKVPFTADSLYNPALNIRFGAFYLSQLLNQFNENQVLALASYNAGPSNAMGWYLQNKEKDIDLFVEDIDFSETRKYVKKVMGNYWFYLKLARLVPLPEK